MAPPLPSPWELGLGRNKILTGTKSSENAWMPFCHQRWMAKEKRHLMMVQEMKRSKVTGISQDWLQGMGNNQHCHGRRPSLVLRCTRLMTRCKIAVKLGCTRPERLNLIDIFYITTTSSYYFSLFYNYFNEYKHKILWNRFFDYFW